MEKSMYLTVQEVASLLGISESYAYKIMRQLNQELKQKGMMPRFATIRQTVINLPCSAAAETP